MYMLGNCASQLILTDDNGECFISGALSCRNIDEKFL
jgi:hypothetical protein